MPHDTYALLDFGNGKRLEEWGAYRLIRPDPTAIGAPHDSSIWKDADAEYQGEKGKGEWLYKAVLPEHWLVRFDDLRLNVRLAPYKHTGVFPEQLSNWVWSRFQAQKAARSLKILNLFAYTGAATVALAKDGHHVTHVDASKPAIYGGKENALLNGLKADSIRWILDDAQTFVKREKKRGNRYDAIILDPPAYGHSPSGKAWRIERDLSGLLEDCIALLSDDPVFVLLNGYAKHDTSESFKRLLQGILFAQKIPKKYAMTSEELALKSVDGRALSTGIAVRCAFH